MYKHFHHTVICTDYSCGDFQLNSDYIAMHVVLDCVCVCVGVCMCAETLTFAKDSTVDNILTLTVKMASTATATSAALSEGESQRAECKQTRE